MLPPLPEFRNPASLIPFSGIQFLDFGLKLDGTLKVNCTFFEEDPPAERSLPVLHALQPDEETGDFLHPDTGRPLASEGLYNFNAAKAVEVFLRQWIPIPFLRELPAGPDGERGYAAGPSNWARVYITPLEPPADGGETHRVILAFDTNLDMSVRPGGKYVGPKPADAEEEQIFAFTPKPAQNGWFVDEAWIDQWLSEALHAYRQARQPNRPLRDTDFPFRREHTARYLTLLAVLEKGCGFPQVKLVDTVSRIAGYSPIDVDLVLDVGNSRTCGILIESDPDETDRLDLNNSYVLELRDLSRPEHVYAHAFESRVEFSRASFGNDMLARRGGRGNSFSWPSFVRVGPEALRLAGGGKGIEGATGLSSPKRYLWDRRGLAQIWRFRGLAQDGTTNEPPVSGPILALVTEEGDVIRQTRRAASPAMRPRFSRSSIFTFLLSEILLQAVVMMNSPATRGRRRNADLPRRLRSIIMTIPPAMPLAERRIMRERAEGAVKLTWEALGWTGLPYNVGVEPRVEIGVDEATCTQLVYLYTEITQKFRGAVGNFFELQGRVRPHYGTQPSLRVASIDIGGGTTDLMVITFSVERRTGIMPVQNFREGFKLAGDDILEAVVARHILPCIEQKMQSCGVPDAMGLLRSLIGNDRGNQAEEERQLRRQFVTQVATPAALTLLRRLELAKPFSDDPTQTVPLLGLLGADQVPSEAVVNFLERKAWSAGAKDFRLSDVMVPLPLDAIANTVRAIIAPTLSDLCEVVRQLDCDVLLVSGRPSRLPVVRDIILARLPLRPDRIIPMHQYRVGTWYPFRDPYGRIDDPKTTVAVGAMLFGLAESRIEGFSMRTSALSVRSTARFIGEIDLSGEIRKDGVLFSDIDLEQKPRRTPPSSVVHFGSPLFIGFRQLPIERWPATRLYYMDFANPQSAGRMKRPLSVTLEQADIEEGEEALKEDFRITEVQDAEGSSLRPGDVVLRLQTLESSLGYWLDTGVISTY